MKFRMEGDGRKTGAKMNFLTQDEIDQFNEEGYLVFEALFDDDHNRRIKNNVAKLIEDRKHSDEEHIIMRYPELGLLTSEPSIVDRVVDLMGGDKFVHHHIHATWHVAGDKGVPWHHDYEQVPQTNRSHLMVHAFMYLDGLNGKIGDLLVLPGTHKKIMNRDAFKPFKNADLPGSRTIDDLAPASVVIVHSAMQHARRPRPGGENYRRYFIDISYCQYGIIWPAPPRNQKYNNIALELGWDREGKYKYLYETGHFFDVPDAYAGFDEKNQGSLAMKL